MTTIIAAGILISCQHQHGASKQPTYPTTLDTAFGYLAAITKKFNPADDIQPSDSNRLTFYYEKSFDTSLLLSFRKEKDKVSAVVYQVNQFYFPGLTDSHKGLERPLFFEGFSFNIDTTNWQNILKDAEAVLNYPSIPGKDYSVFDGPRYILAFNSQIKFNDNLTDDSLLSGYLSSLKHRFLYNKMAEKPVWEKSK
ncbi:MAG: hypothetical protein J7623_19680 [Chitinophaga sp.]|uniref:hypothetical protein n=1 Tax=Chitinophaga sp. TaxID=1869181 RepID=UPI001B01C314|nr:hypothetical protein [Chitinophaga sp.]MBO9730870.1 hypothetical protein [Chitinophaga sp.]